MNDDVTRIDQEILFKRRLSLLQDEVLARTVDIQIDGDGYLEGLYDNEGRRIERKADPIPRDETKGQVVEFKRK